MTNRPENMTGWRARWYEIIFEADTPKGKLFDVVLLIAILGSLLAIVLESVESIYNKYGTIFQIVEWVFTVIFTLEYILRVAVVRNPRYYIFSFYGIIDLLSILPTYLAIVLSGAHYFMAIRSIRLIRVFRILKMVRFLGEANMLSNALKASRIKITVFIVVVMCAVFIMGTVMYLVEGRENGFTSIPVSIYWCIVTLTTVGYGDIAPQTTLGQMIASVIMILGYGIIAVPTGIVTSEIARANQTKADENKKLHHHRCPACNKGIIDPEANFCPNCGNQL
ncbi:ion transporter [Owenweeksia hongkongensis]|uniref:ion transporter n=1 Tax=Owenweeksia hongkongensis TaxID=253245 RepID=UPI003A8D610F